MKYDFVRCGIVSDGGKIVFPDEARIPDKEINEDEEDERQVE